MEYVVQAGQLILSLSLLIVLHELGHYLPSRAFKTRIEKFYLFFDWKFSLFKKKINETEWGIGWIPLGGYVKIAGMVDESMDTEQLKKPPQPWEFRSKPAWQRLIIIVGGIVVNLIVAMVIYAGVLFVWGSDAIDVQKMPHGVAVAQPFKHYGFQDGDQLVAVEGEPVSSLNEVNRQILLRGARSITVAHQNGQQETIALNEDADYEMFETGAFRVFSPRFLARLGEIVPGDSAQKAGFQPRDLITSVDGTPVRYWNEFAEEIRKHRSAHFWIGIEREGSSDSLWVGTDSSGTIGVTWDETLFSEVVTTRHYSAAEAIPAGISTAYWTLYDYAAQLKFLFTKKGASSMGGFITFGKMFPPVWDWRSFWFNTAFISIILAFMNFLPIPALDGGHLLFILYEMVTGRKPHQKVLEYAQVAGFVFILALVLFANGNDIYRAIVGN